MNPNALSPAITDLFLPDPSNEAELVTGDGSPVDAEQFEAYLQAARRSVSVELPTGASPSASRQPAEPPARRADRPDPIRAERSERSEQVDRPDPVERDRVEPDDRPEATDETEIDREADSTERSATEDEATDSTDETASTEVDGEDADQEPTSNQTVVEPVVAEVVVDTTVERPVDEIEVVDGDEATFSVEAAETSVETDVVGIDETSERPDDQIVSTDPIAAVAGPIATQVNTVQETESSDEGDEPAVAVDLGSAEPTTDGEIAEFQVDQREVASTDQEQEVETSDAAESETRSDTGADRQAADNPQESTETTVVDGDDGAPVVGPAPVVRTAQAQTTSNAAVNPVGRIEGTRSRSTVTTPAATQAQGPVVDGDASDPLWLQVRRAMSSVRSLANGDQQVTVRLRPAELGSVVVRINTNDQGTVVSLVADSAVAATQLNQQRQLLVSELEQGGLTSVAVDVGTGETLADAQTDRSDDESDDGVGSQAGAAAIAGSGGSTNRSTNRRRGRSNAGGLVDVDL